MTGDEIVRSEEFNIRRFMALGFGRYEAIRAVEEAIDWYAVEGLLKMACAPAEVLASTKMSEDAKFILGFG